MYDTSIPNASHTPAQDQPTMQGNFSQLATSYNTDHIPLQSGSNVGYSNKLTLVDQSTSPPSGVSGSDVFYAATTSSTSLIELYLQRPSGSAIQFSSGTAQQGATANFGQSFIPGGFQIKWGFETVNTGAVISYTAMSRGLTNFPNATIGVVITPTGSDFTQTSTDASLSASQFTIYTSKNALGVFWVAIGY